MAERRALEPPKTGIFDGLRIVIDPDVGFEMQCFLRLHLFGHLMHHVGVTTLDQWYSDFVETDWRYVERYYETEQIPDWKSCIVTGCPLVTPARIPELRHHQVDVRFAF